MSDMKQTCCYLKAGELKEMTLPSREAPVWNNICWGEFSKTFTPAYWKSQVEMSEYDYKTQADYRTSNSLSDEICACLLGGYGVTAEMSYAAYDKLRREGLTKPNSEVCAETLFERIYAVLSSELTVAHRSVHYRFPRQKAKCIALALTKLARETRPQDELEFRDWLLTFTGIGPKTASWITRNWLGSDKVAIIDIHIFRACTLMGLFEGNEDVSRCYQSLEKKFLCMASAMNVNPARMDMVMWMRMREMGRFGTNAFNEFLGLARKR